MSYYTEGYISKSEVPCNQILDMSSDCPFAGFAPLMSSCIGIEPAQPFKVEVGVGKVPLILFVQTQLNSTQFSMKTIEETVEEKSALKNAATKFTIKVDAQFLLSLKQNHTKVRFELDPECEKIEKITVI